MKIGLLLLGIFCSAGPVNGAPDARLSCGSPVSPSGATRLVAPGLFLEQSNHRAALEASFHPLLAGAIAAAVRQALLLPHLYEVHFLRTNGQCGSVRLATDPEALASPANWTEVQEPDLRESSLFSARQSVVVVPAGGSWPEGCEMSAECEQHFTGLPVELVGWNGRQFWLWRVQLPLSLLLALSAGFITRNRMIRFGFGGALGVTALLAVFIIILIKLTPSQMQSFTKLL